MYASIEAARAGEAEKGFAIVASSISDLATQSAQSAKEIEETIDKITQISKNNVQLATEIKNAIDQEYKVLDHVNQSFDTVDEKLSLTVKAIFDIDNKAKKLSEQKEEVTHEVSTLSLISQKNAESCDETNASMEEMKATMESIHQQAMETQEISEELEELVGFFKL